jgi:hypothetical protein
MVEQDLGSFRGEGEGGVVGGGGGGSEQWPVDRNLVLERGGSGVRLPPFCLRVGIFCALLGAFGRPYGTANPVLALTQDFSDFIWGLFSALPPGGCGRGGELGSRTERSKGARERGNENEGNGILRRSGVRR